MNKPTIGLLLGAGLGVLDGCTAFFYPDTKGMMTGIIIGSTFKGLVAGLLIGFFARKVHNMAAGIAFGVLLSGLFALGVAMMQGNHYAAIIVPGSVVGLIVGFATQKYPHATA